MVGLLGRLTHSMNCSAFVHTESTDIDLVQRLLRGDAAARKDLIERLQPTVRQRVSRVLERQGFVGGCDANDLLQDVLILLLEKQDRILGLWDPQRGLSLESFVGLVAQRTASTILRSGRKTGWAEQPMDGAALPIEADLDTPERHIAQRGARTDPRPRAFAPDRPWSCAHGRNLGVAGDDRASTHPIEDVGGCRAFVQESIARSLASGNPGCQ